MKKYNLMGKKDDQVILCDANCPKCYGTGQRGRVVSCLKNKDNEGKYVPCSCVRTQPASTFIQENSPKENGKYLGSEPLDAESVELGERME